MALSRIELNYNGGQGDITEDDGSDASTSDLAIVYNEVNINNKQEFIDTLDVIMGFIENNVHAAGGAGHNRFYIPKGGNNQAVVFDPSGSFTALNVSTEGDIAIELLPALTNIGVQDIQKMKETLLTLQAFVYQNEFPRA